MRSKKEDKIGRTIQIVVKNTEFKSFNKSVTLDNPTNDYKIIYNKAIDLYDRYFKGITLRLVGVTLQNLISTEEMAVQMSIFDFESHEKEDATKIIINDINRSLKKPLLKRASEVKKNGHN